MILNCQRIVFEYNRNNRSFNEKILNSNNVINKEEHFMTIWMYFKWEYVEV